MQFHNVDGHTSFRFQHLLSCGVVKRTVCEKYNNKTLCASNKQLNFGKLALKSVVVNTSFTYYIDNSNIVDMPSLLEFTNPRDANVTSVINTLPTGANWTSVYENKTWPAIVQFDTLYGMCSGLAQTI